MRKDDWWQELKACLASGQACCNLVSRTVQQQLTGLSDAWRDEWWVQTSAAWCCIQGTHSNAKTLCWFCFMHLCLASRLRVQILFFLAQMPVDCRQARRWDRLPHSRSCLVCAYRKCGIRVSAYLMTSWEHTAV